MLEEPIHVGGGIMEAVEHVSLPETAAEKATIRRAATRVRRLDHHAFYCRDIEATRHFYEDILELKLVATMAIEDEDGVGRPQKYAHVFFELADNSSVAFFDCPTLDDPNIPQGNVNPFVHHIALHVDAYDDLLYFKKKMADNNVGTFFIDHGFCVSLYFNDPNGMQAELSWTTAAGADYFLKAESIAPEELKKWVAEKPLLSLAKQSGAAMTLDAFEQKVIAKDAGEEVVALKPGAAAMVPGLEPGRQFRFHDELAPALLEKMTNLRPLLEQHVEGHEANGELSEEVVSALDETGVFRMAVPTRLGGLGISSQRQVDIVAEIAKVDPSAAWVVSIVNSCTWLASTTSWDMQKFVFAKGCPRVCGPTNGMGTLTPDGDDLILNGSWTYGSASHHSEFVIVPVRNPDGIVACVVPMNEIVIESSWQVAGLKGTGSDTLVFKDVRVTPRQYVRMDSVGLTSSLKELFPIGQAPADEPDRVIEPTDYWQVLPLLRSKSMGVLIGALEGLLAEVVKTQAKPIIYTSYKVRGESHMFQGGIGQARAKLWAARTIVLEVTEINDRAAIEARALTEMEMVHARGQISVAVELLTSVADKLMNLAGSSAFMNTSPAQRFWRDFSVGVRHVCFHTDAGFEITGRNVLGVEPNIAPLDFY